MRTSRWVGLVVLAALAMTAFVLLGIWQFGRYETKAAAAAHVAAVWDEPAVTVDAVLAMGLTVSDDDEWRRVELRGPLVADSLIVLRNRPIGGSAATQVLGLVQARRADGSAVGVVVALGWTSADTVPTLEDWPGEAVVRLRPEEAASDKEQVAGQVTSFNTAQILAAMGAAVPADLPVLQGYGELVEPLAPLNTFTKPEADLGNHLSYAFQWWLFAAAVPVGVVYLIRRERSEETPRPVRRRTGRAEAEEDALLDALEAQARDTSSM